jgi:hypothetical protein
MGWSARSAFRVNFSKIKNQNQKSKSKRRQISKVEMLACAFGGEAHAKRRISTGGRPSPKNPCGK